MLCVCSLLPYQGTDLKHCVSLPVHCSVPHGHSHRQQPNTNLTLFSSSSRAIVLRSVWPGSLIPAIFENGSNDRTAAMSTLLYHGSRNAMTLPRHHSQCSSGLPSLFCIPNHGPRLIRTFFGIHFFWSISYYRISNTMGIGLRPKHKLRRPERFEQDRNSSAPQSPAGVLSSDFEQSDGSISETFIRAPPSKADTPTIFRTCTTLLDSSPIFRKRQDQADKGNVKYAPCVLPLLNTFCSKNP